MEKLIPVALLLVTVLYSGIVSVSGNPDVPDDIDLNSQMDPFKFAVANIDFFLRLYRQIASQPSSTSQNIFFSPISISAALAMLSLGAKHNTRDQLQQVLGFSNMTQNDAAEMHMAFEYLRQWLTKEGSDLHLMIGNSLHVQQEFILKKKFLEDTRKFYKAEAASVDFKAPEKAKEQINTYVKNQTNGKIQDFIKELDRDTVMILLNYVFFKGKWVEPFDPWDTFEADFHVDTTTTVKVQMMKRMGMYQNGYIQEFSSSVIIVPYKGYTALVLILPDPGKLAEAEQNLDKFQDLFYSRISSADLHLPKLSLKASYKLKDLLRMMGIIDAFSDNADLTGISETDRLKVSEVAHEAVLDFDEKGTEATACQCQCECQIMPMSTPSQYVFNRPFLLIIGHYYTKSILFAGRVMNPTV